MVQYVEAKTETGVEGLRKKREGGRNKSKRREVNALQQSRGGELIGRVVRINIKEMAAASTCTCT
jgi:hypothetical protein